MITIVYYFVCKLAFVSSAVLLFIPSHCSILYTLAYHNTSRSILSLLQTAVPFRPFTLGSFTATQNPDVMQLHNKVCVSFQVTLKFLQQLSSRHMATGCQHQSVAVCQRPRVLYVPGHRHILDFPLLTPTSGQTVLIPCGQGR